MLAGAEAPILRSATRKTIERRFGVLDKDGNVVRYVSGLEALKGLAKVHELAHVVAEGVRPEMKPCERCGLPIAVNRRGKVKSKCEACYFGRCPNCGVVKKDRKSEMCKPCAMRARHGDMPATVACEGCGKPLKRRWESAGHSQRCLPCAHKKKAETKVACCKGHMLTDENTIVRRRGERTFRRCRECTNARAAESSRARRGGPPLSRSDVARKAWVTRRAKQAEAAT